MAEPLRIKTLAQLRMVLESGSGLVITDPANPRVFHADPAPCPRVSESAFETKVIVNQGRNGAYFAVGSFADARAAWPEITVCRSQVCTAAATDEGDGESGLAPALRAASGGARVRRRTEPPTGVEAMMENWESSQRVALAERDGRLLLCTWPGELSGQAHAFYGSDRAERVAALVSAPGTRWTAVPRPHLAYNGARVGERFYFRCDLAPADYLENWSRPEDLQRAGGNPPESVPGDLWPWLCRCGYADPTDPAAEAGLERFLVNLERRNSHAHLRPGLELSSYCDGSEGPGSPRLQREVESRIRELAGVLREPLG